MHEWLKEDQTGFPALKPGDTVYVDVRQYFLEDPKWAPATFVRYENKLEGWEDKYIPKVRNTMIVEYKRPPKKSSLPGHVRIPLLDALGDGLYKVSTQDVRWPSIATVGDTMKKGDKVKVVGPVEWLQHVGVHNRLDHVGTLAVTGPVDFVAIPGRGMTTIFRVRFDDAQEGMFHHVPGPCLEVVTD